MGAAICLDRMGWAEKVGKGEGMGGRRGERKRREGSGGHTHSFIMDRNISCFIRIILHGDVHTEPGRRRSAHFSPRMSEVDLTVYPLFLDWCWKGFHWRLYKTVCYLSWVVCKTTALTGNHFYWAKYHISYHAEVVWPHLFLGVILSGSMGNQLLSVRS